MDSKLKAEPLWALPSWLRSWERFWFAPADPTVLGLMRICCGALAVYTLFAYSFQLQEMMGPYAWADLELTLTDVRERPTLVVPLLSPAKLEPARPSNAVEQAYVNAYQEEFKDSPPAPFPIDDAQADFLRSYRREFNIDARVLGLRPPESEWERAYLMRFSRRWHGIPSAYAKDKTDEDAVNAYIERHGAYVGDPRSLYARGVSVWSLWFHITDPAAMAVIHGLIVMIFVLFTIGFATRVTSVLAWFGSLCYIHRNVHVLFGVDTMMNILMLYFMIGPSGAALSVDRLIARWWSKAKPDVVRRWYQRLGRPAPADDAIAPAIFLTKPEPSVSANFALRLVQIHVCIIYMVAGVAKLQGTSWWDGTAVWATIANFEFAPMHTELYNNLLRFLSGTPLLWQGVMNIGTYFTLAFEIGYAFLIWRPATRWWFLSGAIFLHGLIGLIMGLSTFSLMMLVMNMAFIRPDEVHWLLHRLQPRPTPAVAPILAQPAPLEPVASSMKE